MNKDLNFEYIEEFADYIAERVTLDEELFVSVVGNFEEIKSIIKEIFCIAEVDFENLNIESPIMSGYEDEYILDCWSMDGVMQIGCEPAKRDGEYFNIASDEIYLLEDCSSKIIPLCKGSELYFVNSEDDCDCDEECDECCACGCHCGDSCVEYDKSDDGELHGFIASKSTDNGYHSYSFYTSDKLNKSDVCDILKQFGF